MKKNKLILFVMVALFATTISHAQKPTLLKTSVGNSNASAGVVVGNTFYFKKDGAGTNVKQLWKTDGTAAGTQMVRDSFFYDVVGLVSIKDTLYFVSQSAFNSTAPLALWKSNGTKAGTTIVKTFPGLSGVGFLTVINNICYMRLGNAVWKTDGTATGSIEVKPAVIAGSAFYQAGSEIVFFGSSTGTSYQALWKTDGTPNGTTKIKDSIANPSKGNVVGEYVNTGGKGFFGVSSGASYNLWRTDGSKAGTFVVTSGTISNLTGLNGVLYFRNFVSFKQGLWKSDGTVVGTVAVAGIGNIGSWLTSMGNSLYLGGKNDYDFEPYKSDGTATGTILLKDIVLGTTGSNPLYFTKVNNTMTFVANDGINGNQIWKTDGTPGGTTMAYAVTDTISKNEAPTVRIAFGNYLLFIHGGGTTGDLYSLLVSTVSSAPTAPTNLALTPQKKQAKGKMKLTWNDNSSNELGFIIERSLTGGSYTTIDTVQSDISTFTDTGLNASTRYYYRVAAYNTAGNSAYSNAMDATTLARITEVMNLNDFVKIYPNPSSGKFEVSIGQSITEPTTLRVTDMLGRDVYSEMLQNGLTQYNLDLSYLKAGIYIVYCNNVFLQKLVLEK